MASKAGPGLVALAALDGILAREPEPDQNLFSQATHCLSLYRDGLISASPGIHRTPEARQRLDHVNAVISILMAGHFPLGPLPWPELHKARGWLAKAVAAI